MPSPTPVPLLLAFMVACGHGGTAGGGRPPSSGVAGVVRSRAAPVGDAVLVITELRTSERVAVVHTDRAGRFEADLPAGRYAITVTASAGYAWIDEVTAPAVSLSVDLSAECSLLAGRVDAAQTTRTHVLLSRYSMFTGDTFAAAPNEDGRFAVCLPAATYVSYLAGDLVSPRVGVRVPSGKELTLVGNSPDQVRAPAPAPVPTLDLSGMAAAVQKGPRLLGLGEPNHGSRDFIEQRGALTLELARVGGVRHLLLEADTVLARALDAYVQGGDVDLRASVAAMGFWIWDVEELLGFLEEVRTYNASASPTQRLHIWGIDVQNTEAPARTLLDSAGELGLTDVEKELIRAIGTERGKPVKSFSPEQRSTAENVLTRIAAGSDFRALAARSLRHQLAYFDDEDLASYDRQREQGMTDIVVTILRLTGSDRAVLWAHNAHVGREPDGAVDSLGQRLASELGADYYPIGFFGYQGSARAWDPLGEVGVIPHELASAPGYTVEAAVITGNDREVAFVPFDTAPAPFRAWLATPRYVREFGAGFPGHDDTWRLRAMLTAFDAIAVVRSIEPTTPTATGERRVTK